MRRYIYQFTIISTCWLLCFAGSCNNSSNNGEAKEKQDSADVTITKDLDSESFKIQYAEEKNAYLIDVRTPQEVSEGYIAGAKNIDFYQENFMKKINELDKNKPVYLYCRSGGRSGKATAMLKEAGFVETYNLLGGFNGWKAAGNDILIPPQ